MLDPVGFGDGESSLSQVDFVLRSAAKDLVFERYFSSYNTRWVDTRSLGYRLPDGGSTLADGGFITPPYVPVPFSLPSKSQGIHWTHSFHSFVYLEPGSDWQVRLPTGEFAAFTPCTGSCIAQPRADSKEARALLVRDTGTQTFRYVAPDGLAYAYSALLQTAPGAGFAPVNRYYLTSIQQSFGSTVRTLATIAYAPPSTTDCPNPPGMMAGTGVPYISSVTSAEGQVITARYKANYAGGGWVFADECLLHQWKLGSQVLVQYDYDQYSYGQIGVVRNYADNLATVPSYALVTSPDLWKHRAYQGKADAGRSEIMAGTPAFEHVIVGNRVIKSTRGVAGFLPATAEYEVAGRAALSCPPNTSCLPNSAVGHSWVTSNLTTGTGAGTPAAVLSTGEQVSLASAFGARTNRLGTDGGEFVSWEMGTTASGPFTSKVVGSRGDVVMAADAGIGANIAVTSVTQGRAGGASGAVETTNYTYTQGTVAGAPVQLVQTESRTSLLTPAGTTTMKYQYDGTRVKGVVRQGTTRTWNGTAFVDTTRFIGTFYRTVDSCGAGPDALQHTLQVDGPCLVGSIDATACTESSYPVVRFSYYGAGNGNNSHRLQTMTRLRTGVGCASGLTTTYAGYDARGNATSVTDENSVVTTRTFEADRMTSMSVAGQTWLYEYDHGKLTRVQHPEGNSEVICYRKSPSLAGGCSMTEQMTNQPTGMFRYGSGSAGGAWYEATLLTYANDGELREEAVYQAGNTTTPFRRTTRERNPLGFTTFEKTGPTPSGSGERTTRQFAADGLVVAQSTPYFAAPDFCGTPGAPSELCTQFEYWNTSRLKQMKVKPLTGAADITVCLDYDAHGNVIGVKPGCTTTGMHSYVWDDFGNVVQAMPGSVSAPIRLEYDARGNVTKKVLTVDASTVVLAWDYDMLSRPTQARENATVVSSWLYDTDPAQATNLPTGCTGPKTPARTMGRMVWATDAVWRTWYSYDEFGRVTREARVNAAGLPCTDVRELGRQQYIERTFSPSGNELTVRYPSGRVVTNAFDSTARLSSVAMTTWNFGWSAAPGTTVAANVSWFPGGTLKSYETLARTTVGGTPSTVTISYRYGSTGNLATDSIPTCQAADVDANGTGDSSGRLRALYVTRGTTNVLRIFYRWKGEQLIEQSRCYLNSTSPESEYFLDPSGADPAFQYDRAGRLLGGNQNTFWSTGGYGVKRAFSYDTRGNRTKLQIYGGAGMDLNYFDASNPDRLSAAAYNDGATGNPVLGVARDGNGNATVPVYSGKNRGYSYDTLGRTTAITGTNGSTGWSMSLYAAGGNVTGSETVLRYATLNDNFGSQSFNYYYDTQNRRIRKQYPNGDLEGYFWSADKRLLMETAPESIGSANQAMDEYVWLGQWPLLMLRSSYPVSGTLWSRDRADWDAGWCARRGQAVQCRPYGIVSDYLGKPVMTFDSARLVSGVLEYDPFGVVNRTSHWGEVAPAANGCFWVTYGMSQGAGPLMREMRTHAPRVDISTPGCIGQYSGNPAVQRDIVCGPRWNYWAPWQFISNGDSMHLLYCSNSSTNYNPQPFGISVDGYEYKEYESGATHYIPPFRLPGQYFDAETDLNENWNRYYDPSTGRYLSPEPLLQNPNWVALQLEMGRQVPAYSYALNNPIANVDRNGLAPGAAAIPFFTPWSPVAAAATAGWGTAAASVGATAAGAGLVAGVFAAAGAGIGMFHDPPAGIPYPPVGAPTLPHPSDEPGVGDVPIPAPVCMDESQPSRQECKRRRLAFVLGCIRNNCTDRPQDRELCIWWCQAEGEGVYRTCLGPNRGGI